MVVSKAVVTAAGLGTRLLPMSKEPWNDESIVPLSINGNTRDPRVGKKWDWFALPHECV